MHCPASQYSKEASIFIGHLNDGLVRSGRSFLLQRSANLVRPPMSARQPNAEHRTVFRYFVTAIIFLFTRSTIADTIVLDDFSTGINGTVIFSQVSSPGTAAAGNTPSANKVNIRRNTRAVWTDTRSVAGSMLWNSRAVNISRGDAGTGSTLVAINATSSSAMEIANPDDATALSALVTYQNSGTPLLIDLSAMATFNIDVSSLDSLVPMTLSLRDSDNNVGSANFTLSNLSLGRQSLSLASIFNSIDETKVVRADLTFSVPTGGDLAFQQMYFAPVPEPSTVVIVAAIAAIALARRRTQAPRSSV